MPALIDELLVKDVVLPSQTVVAVKAAAGLAKIFKGVLIVSVQPWALAAIRVTL